jgi:hypothetical protein
MPLHVAIWSQIVLDSDVSWEDQGKAIRLLANAWSSGELVRKPWASDEAWGAAERMWPEMALVRAGNLATRDKLSESGRRGNAVRWGSPPESPGESPGESPPESPGESPPESPPDRIQSRSNKQKHNQNQKQKPKKNISSLRSDIVPADKPPVRVVVPEVEPRETWLTPYCRAWTVRTGGEMVAARALKPLARLRKEHGDAAVLAAWGRYLDATPVEFCGVTAFAAKFGQWAGTTAPPLAREYQLAERILAEGPVDPFEASLAVARRGLLS